MTICVASGQGYPGDTSVALNALNFAFAARQFSVRDAGLLFVTQAVTVDPFLRA